MKMPKIRFKANDNTDYPDWNDNNLGELGSFYGGLSGKSKEDFVGGNCRYITYKNVYLNTFATPCSNDLVKIKPSEHQNKVKKFDVLFTQSSETFEEVGLSSIYLYDDEPYLNSFCKGFRFRNLDHICPEFIGYQLRSNKVRHAIMLMGQGISRINLRTEFLCKLTLSLPTLAEQHKIADLLLGVDAIIEKQQTEVATWEQYKKGLAQKLFDQEVRFKADDGSDFLDWESKILGELGSFYGGLSGKSKEDFVDGTCPYITYKNVYLNTFATPISDDKVKITPQERQNKVKQFDVLFTQSSETFEEVGLSSVYLYDDEPYLNSFCKGFRFNNLEQIYPKFIGYLLRSDKVRHDIILMGQGISRINLRTQYLSKLNFKLPSLAEQRKIAECLDAIDEVITLAKAELDKWRELKKGLLQQLFV